MGITTKTRVNLELTADDWELYYKPGRSSAARSINRQIASIVNRAADSGSAWRRAWEVLDQYAEYGAADSEGAMMLDRILRRAFPHDRNAY